MFSVSNDDLWHSLGESLWYSLKLPLRHSLCDALNDSLRISMKSVYKGVEYVLCV